VKIIMKIKNVLMAVTAVFALGFAMHRGFSQEQQPSPYPKVIGPGLAPNAITPTDPSSLSYYGGYYGGFNPEPSYNTVASLYNVSFGPQDIPQTSSKVTTKLTSTALSFTWEGEPRAIQSITVSTVDKNNSVLASKVITALPARATLKRSTKATGYTVSIQYINGLSNSITSPL
jgi:hypothetical protein